MDLNGAAVDVREHIRSQRKAVTVQVAFAYEKCSGFRILEVRCKDLFADGVCSSVRVLFVLYQSSIHPLVKAPGNFVGFSIPFAVILNCNNNS